MLPTKSGKDSKGAKDNKGAKDRGKSKTTSEDKTVTKTSVVEQTTACLHASYSRKPSQPHSLRQRRGENGPQAQRKEQPSKSYKAPDSDDEEQHYLVNVHIKSNTASVLAAKKRTKFRDWEIVLDTGANGSLFVNTSLVTEIHREDAVSFDGISGVLSTDTVGDFYGLCKVHIRKDAIANISPFSKLRKMGHSITYDQREGPDDDSFTIAHRGMQLRFLHRVDGLYVHDTRHDHTCLVSTVAENEAQYSRREVSQAHDARQLQRRLANPPDTKLIKALSTGTIQNTSVTPADVTRATEIYETSIEALKGRTTAARAFLFPQETPTRTTAEQRMYADIFFAAGNAFEITIVHPIGHIICSHIDKSDTPTLRRALRTHLGTYGQRSITIRHIYIDNEKGILCMGQDFAGAGITLHLAGPGIHVHIIERTIRYVKEGVRGILAGLPYPCPRIIFNYMVPFVANRLNMFPSSTRTDNISAYQLIYNRHVNATINCQLEFGAYYQVHNRLMNNTPRTIGAIGVGQSNDGSGTCTFVGLHNLAPFKANTFKLLPMPSEAIALLTRIAVTDKIKVNKDPIFQINALQNPALDEITTATTETTLTPADDNYQNLKLLDTTHTDRAVFPPPSTHRADDLLPPSAPTLAETDSGEDTPMHADDRQVQQTTDIKSAIHH